MWKRKTQQQIEFFNSEPSIIDNFPIIEAKDLKLKWVTAAKKDFQSLVRSPEMLKKEGYEFKHIVRCPGIFDLFKCGYIVSLHKDVVIKAGQKEFSSISPGEGETDSEHNHLGPFISHQPIDFVGGPPWAVDYIIKLNTGWHVVAPKGVKFLQIPISYPDTFDFTCITGIFDPAILTEVTFQMYWNVVDQETLIRAGTPLGHLIPLTEKKYEWVQRIMNQKDRDWVKKSISAYSSSFAASSIRGKVVEMYKKYWKR